MTQMQLQHIETVDLVDEHRAETLDVQLEARVVAMRTRVRDTRVVMHLHDDGSVRLQVYPTDNEPYDLICPPQMPYLTLHRLLEAL